MKNIKGFARFEVLTAIVLILLIVSFLMVSILNSVKNQKLNAMVKSAKNFSSAVLVDNVENSTYYLRDAINDDLFEGIKSPFSSANCDIDESKIDYVDSQKYVTLKCDDYLIYSESSDNSEFNIYKVSEWLDSKVSKKSQDITVYNCKKNDKLLLDDYYDEVSFLYYFNKKYKTDYYDMKDITECKVVSQELYRSLKLVRQLVLTFFLAKILTSAIILEVIVLKE